MDAVHLELTSTPSSVREARRFVAATLTGAGLGHLVDTAALLVSELSANAVLHAHGAFAVEVTLVGPVVRIGVRDTSAQAPHRCARSPLAGSGRGLAMVETLAQDWGTERIADSAGPYRKTVWFTLPLEDVGVLVPA